MPSLTGLGILSFPFPGTAVPGYRLFRPYGTGPDGAKVPLPASQVRPSDSLVHEPGWTSCHSTVDLWQYKRRVVDKIASTGKVGRPMVRFPGLLTTYPQKTPKFLSWGKAALSLSEGDQEQRKRTYCRRKCERGEEGTPE
jgi:hypothetical protein